MIYVIEFIIAMVATLSFAVIFSAPRKELLFCGFTGAIGWIIYYILFSLDYGVIFSSAVATFFLSIIARSLAVVRRNPATVYLLTGIFPLVPGAGIFYTVYYLLLGDNQMFSTKGIETFEIAAAIVFTYFTPKTRSNFSVTNTVATETNAKNAAISKVLPPANQYNN